MTTPKADEDLQAMAGWSQCPYVDPASGRRCDYPLSPGDTSEHPHGAYDERDLDVPPWHRRVVLFPMAEATS